MFSTLRARSGSRYFVGALILIAVCNSAMAQTRRPPAATTSPESLAGKEQQLEQDYVTGLYEVAEGYIEAGEIERAKAVLNAILTVKPDTPIVKEKLEELDEAVFDAKSHTIEVDAAKGWTATGIVLTKDQPVRFSTTGTYRFIANDNVDADGFANDDPLRDMVNGVPAGGLMGIIIPPPRNTGGRRQPAPEPGKPFFIGTSRDFEPGETGTLLVRVNTPPGSKSIGKLKVTVSGNIQPAQ